MRKQKSIWGFFAALAVMCIFTCAAAASDVASVEINGSTTTYDNFSDAWTAATGADTATVTLLGDVDSLSSYIQVSSDDDITLDLNGYTLDRGLATAKANGYIIYVNGGKFTLDDSSAAGTGVVTGGYNKSSGMYGGAGVYVINSGTFIMNGGSIKGNKVTGNITYGGGVCVTKGTFTMNGGAIEENEALSTTGSGVGVFLGYSGGSFTMNGGTIRNNKGYLGVGVYISGSTFTLNDGTIEHNTATSSAGGVYMNSGTFTMNSGEISNNEAATGSGVYKSSGTFTMNGGEISNNEASNYGGGVYMYNTGTFTMNGGEISNNEASNYGGGVYIFRYGGTFTMEGGTISNNTATSGGGVYLDSGKTFNLTGGTVDGNTATTSGGGVYVYSKGTFNMTGGEVSNNTAASSGGGVYNEGTLSITNSTVTKNTAETYGGGIYAGNGFTISGLVDITENTVNGEANNAYLSSGKVITVDGTPDDATMVGVTTANPPTEDSYVNVTGENSGDYTEYFSSDGNYFVLNSSANQVQLAVITSGIYVQYEKISGNTWNINLVGGGTSSIIYRFLAAQLKFAIDNPDIAYTIKPVSGINLTENNGVYEFNLSNSTASGTEKAITAHSITIGTVTFAGVGDFEFGVDETYEDNEAQTAVYNSVDNNLIRTYYVPDVSGTIDSELYIDDVITDTLSLDTASLTINVMFPNAVTAQGDAYNDMKVTINGVNKTDEEIYFGTGTQGSLNADGVVIYGADADNYTGAAGYTTTVNDVYQGYAYTLVFEGAGYRTFRTTVVPASDSATVTVWNNAMDNNMVVVSTTDDAMGGDTEKVTFLAGDIVADENINLYDLSAVVSYFGKTNDTDYTSEFAKYDLDRDGKIDSKDIAMVLVSWNK